MRSSLLAAVVTSLLGSAQSCGGDKLLFFLDDVTLSPGEEKTISLSYREQDLFPERGNICAFEIHVRYDAPNLLFSNCEGIDAGGDATHNCASSSFDPGHPGLLCVCNASSPGHLEIVAISADAITPLPRGLISVAELDLQASLAAPPGLYPLEFERPGEGDQELAYVLCDSLASGSEAMSLWDGSALVLDPKPER